MTDPKEYHKWLQQNAFIMRATNINKLTKMEETLLDIEMIDAYVEHMGDDLPDAEYIIRRVQKRLDNDSKY